MRLSIRPTLATGTISKEKLERLLLHRRPIRPDQLQTSFIQAKVRFSTSVGAARNLTTKTF
jgi:hypothetical protein